MSFDLDEMKVELDKAGISWKETEEKIGDEVYIGLQITGNFMDLPKEVRHRFYSETKPPDWPRDRDYLKDMEQAHGEVS